MIFKMFHKFKNSIIFKYNIFNDKLINLIDFLVLLDWGSEKNSR